MVKAIEHLIKRTYYKYKNYPWSQGQMGANYQLVNHFAVTSNQQAYYPNSGNINIYHDEYIAWIDIYSYSDEYIIPKGFKFYSHGGWSSASGVYNISFHASKDNITWYQIGTSGNVGEGNWGYIDMSYITEGYKHFRFVCSSGGHSYEDNIVISSLQLIGELLIPEEVSASEDWDYYADKYEVSMVKEAPIKHYYKHGYENWEQPTFSSNVYHDTFNYYEVNASHSSGAPWNAFNKSLAGDNCWWTNHGQTSSTNPCWLTFRSKTGKMKFNKVTIMNENTSPENFKHGYVQVSNNGTDWTNIAEMNGTNTASYETVVPLNINTPYEWYRLYFDDSYSTGGVSIQLITFEGQRAVVIPGTSSDYEYYEETFRTKAVRDYVV